MASSATKRPGPPPSHRRVREAPPIVHALGGSIGSALALLLFYPLERARIELQSRAGEDAAAPGDGDGDDSSSSASEAESAPREPLVPGVTGAISPIRETPGPAGRGSPPECDDNNVDVDVCVGGVAIGEEEESWDRPADDSPSSWSMNSCSNDGRSFSSIHFGDDSDDGHSHGSGSRSNSDSNTNSDSDSNRDENADSIVKCLLDLRARGMLYKGAKPIISTTFASYFVFFFLHASAKRWLSPSSTEASSPYLSLLTSCLAGIGNVLLTNPLWVTNMAIVRGSTETQDLFRECWRLWKTEGAKHMWKGTDASLMLVSNPIIQFVCYEQFKRMLLASKARRRSGANARRSASANANAANGTATVALGAAEAFVIAALAKAIATVGTYPLQLTQTLLRLTDNKNSNSNSNNNRNNTAGERGQQRYEGTIDCLIQLYKTNNAGCGAWFRGMRAKLLQTVLTAAFTFLTYEQILGVVQNVAMRAVGMRRKRIDSGRR